MKKSLQVFVFTLALATTYTLAQTSSTPDSMGNTGSTASSTANQNTSHDTMGQSSSSSTMDQTGSMDKDKDNKSAMVDDQTLHRQVHEQLASNPNLQNVQVEVDKGTVKLTGSVNSKDDRKEAKKLAKSVAGVKKVKDDIQVSATNAGTGAMGSTSSSSSTSTNN